MKTTRPPWGVILWATCASLFVISCGPGSGGGDEPAQQARRADTAGAQRVRQAEFLNRIRASDPRYETIEKAILNENNDLGLVLNRKVQIDAIPGLLKAVLTEMSSQFPGQDLKVIAYTPTQPPVRIGTARLNAHTREMFYEPEPRADTH